MWTNLKTGASDAVTVSLDPFTAPFTGASVQEPGTAGLVPPPPAGAQGLPLRGDGSFGTLDVAAITGLVASVIAGLAPSATVDTTNAANISSGTIPAARLPNIPAELLPASAALSPSTADQTITGGANVTPLALSSGNVTIDCGARPLQHIQNNGAFTITAPTHDGSCMLDIVNTSIAGAVTWAGFTAGANTGDALTTANGAVFRVGISRINSISTYVVKALQ